MFNTVGLGSRLDVNEGDGCTHTVAQHTAATVKGDQSGAVTFRARFRVNPYVLHFAIPTVLVVIG